GSTPGAAAIIQHPDVQRMLMTMRALTEACRALSAVAAAAYDIAHAHPDATTGAQNRAFHEFLVPLLKGYATESSLEVVDFVVAQAKAQPNAVFAGAVPYLMLAGNLVAGWQMARALLAAERRLAAGDDVEFMRAKIATARFYADHILTRAPGLRDAVVEGAAAVGAMPLEAF
ncbi:MAG TPA: acyl-CoA dehydrogenase, partial [Tahibacter sp.]|nr:acyl-CoA dehydrogenase [Tahibacter sp.]